MPEPRLDQLQGWMRTIITSRGNLQQKLEQAAAEYQMQIGEVVAAKRGVSAERRMDIYAAGYVLRLLECLRADFPGLRAFMGEELFELFAKAYIVSLPPQSWSLFQLSERFPQFLEDTSPAGQKNIPAAMFELPAEIARFERTRATMAWIKGMEGDAFCETENAAGIMDYLLGETTVQAAPCLCLLEQKYPLQEFLQQLETGLSPPPPMPQTTRLAFTRKHYRLRIHELEHWQFVFLEQCHQPTALQECARIAAEVSGTDIKTILAAQMVWLPLMREMGCLQ